MSQLTFSDIMIRPQYSTVRSRSNVDVAVDMGKFKLKLPVISANMKHITGPKMAIAMALHGGMGILYRGNTVEDAVKDYKEVMNAMEFWPEGTGSPKPHPPIVGVSIGVKKADRRRFEALYKAGARIVCIDQAHGHCIMMREMISFIRSKVGNKVTLICGNIATKEGAISLQQWGADVLKVGIGPGSVCVTRKNTGVGVPQLHAIMEVAEVAKVPFIADGGLKEPGDVAKALIWADAVMVGSMVAGTTETPGKVYKNEDGEFYKVFGGSASGEVKEHNEFVEGIMKTVKFRGRSKYILKEIKHGVQSACSYSGAHNLNEFQAMVKWDVISGSAQRESKY